MKKNQHVEITTKTGRSYVFDHVINIGYNFNHGSMINLSIKTADGSASFKTFFKKDIESIYVDIPKSNDSGNDQEFHDEDGNQVSKDLFNEDTQAMM